MRQLAEASGGRTLSPDDLAFAAGANAFSAVSLKTPLLAASCFLLFADIFLRRFGSVVRSLEKRLKRRPAKAAKPVPQPVKSAAPGVPAHQNPAVSPKAPVAAPKPNTAGVLAATKRKRRM
jgi:hypothetical protein